MQKYLLEHAAQMGLEITGETANDICTYHELLVEANKQMNLTRIGEDISEACDRNYLDCLALLPHLKDAKKLIDVGSGAGFPGLPIAIARRDLNIVLMDTLNKRVEFLQSVVDTLKLDNVKCVHMRCEDAAKSSAYRDAFDIATARAVADMSVLTEWLLPFVKPGGRMLALKGANCEEETKVASYAIETLCGAGAEIYNVDIPGRDWQHKVVEVVKLGRTPERFPRKPGIAEKRPLKA